MTYPVLLQALQSSQTSNIEPEDVLEALTTDDHPDNHQVKVALLNQGHS